MNLMKKINNNNLRKDLNNLDLSFYTMYKILIDKGLFTEEEFKDNLKLLLNKEDVEKGEERNE